MCMFSFEVCTKLQWPLWVSVRAAAEWLWGFPVAQCRHRSGTCRSYHWIQNTLNIVLSNVHVSFRSVQVPACSPVCVCMWTRSGWVAQVWCCSSVQPSIWYVQVIPLDSEHSQYCTAQCACFPLKYARSWNGHCKCPSALQLSGCGGFL